MLVLLSTACGEPEAERAVSAVVGGKAGFQSVERHGDRVCGEVNGPGTSNRYARFIYDETARTAAVEPAELYTELQLSQFAQTCHLMQANGAGTLGGVCQEATKARANSQVRERFTADWDHNCH